MSATCDVVVLLSGTGSNLQALIDSTRTGESPVRIAAVISNRADAYGLQRAAQMGIPQHTHRLVTYKQAGRTRQEYDADLAAIVAPYAPDWVVLAGWMHILSNAFLTHFPNRVLNLHPALPGAFAGTHAIERAFEAYQRGEISNTGIMVHLVPDERVDEGPVLATATVPFYPADTLETVEQRIHSAEHDLLVNTLTALVGDNLQIS